MQATGMIPVSYLCSGAHPYDNYLLVHIFFAEYRDTDNASKKKFLALCDPLRLDRSAAMHRILQVSQCRTLLFSPTDGHTLMTDCNKRSLDHLSIQQILQLSTMFLSCNPSPFFFASIGTNEGLSQSSTLRCSLIHHFPFAESPQTAALAFQHRQLTKMVRDGVDMDQQIAKHSAAVKAPPSTEKEDFGSQQHSPDASRRASLLHHTPHCNRSPSNSSSVDHRNVQPEMCVRVAVAWWALLRLSTESPLRWPDTQLHYFTKKRAHFESIQTRRKQLLTVDISAGAAAYSELHSNKALRWVNAWARDKIHNAIGYVGDLVGAAMEYQPNWHEEERPTFGADMKRVHFGLHPRVIMLNGSRVGVLSLPVRRARIEWEKRVQIDPVLWRFKSLATRLSQAVTKISKHVQAQSGDVNLFVTKDQALFTVFRSLPWIPGDKLLLIEHSQQAQIFAQCTHLSKRYGVEVVIARINQFATDDVLLGELARALQQVNPKVLLFPHVTELGRLMPVPAIIQMCAEEQVSTVVDGTDAIGNLKINIGILNADFYIARMDCYAFCYPGTSLLVTKSSRQDAVSSLTVSYHHGEGYTKEWTYTGLSDQTTWLVAAHGFQFQKYICSGFREYCRNLATEANRYLCELWGVPPLFEETTHGIFAIQMPNSHGRSAADALHTQTVLAQNRVHVGVICVKQQDASSFLAIRVTCQVYNDMHDIRQLGALVQAIAHPRVLSRNAASQH